MKSGSVVSKLVIGLFLMGVIISLPDIKRYIRISTM
jgi:hypothetical protein